MFVLAIGLATLLAACGGDDSADKANDQKSEETAKKASQDIKITDEEKVDEDKVVSKINGEIIKGKQYNDSYASMKMSMSQNGQDISDTQKIKDQTLKFIVQKALIRQDAKSQGIEVSQEKVEKEFNTIKEQNGDNFAKLLKENNLTEESLKNQIEFELLLVQYAEQEIKSEEVTDEEVQAYYDTLKEQSKEKELPKFEEIKEQIKSQLARQKQSQQLQAKLEELKKNAEIKHMI